MFEDFLLIEFRGKQQFEQFLNGLYSYLSIYMQYPSGRDLTNLQNTIKNDIHQHKRYANSFVNITHRASHLIIFRTFDTFGLHVPATVGRLARLFI